MRFSFDYKSSATTPNYLIYSGMMAEDFKSALFNLRLKS